MRECPQNFEESLISLISSHQGLLHRYILSLLPDWALADDVLQETNLILWRKAKEYDDSRPFAPWAMSIAWNQVKAARRDSSRDRHVFNDELVETLAQEAEGFAQSADVLGKALDDCLNQLPTKHRDLILARYEKGGSVKSIAAAQGRTATALSLTLMRIRKLIENCIQQKLPSA